MEVITPENREHWLKLRSKDVTSTEVAALFGFSPYLTKFELWHRKKGNLIVDFKENERTIWGSRLQHSIAQGIAEDNGWTVTNAPEYIRDTELRLGASFDFWIDDDGFLEVKNVDGLQFREGWIVDEDKNIEAPPHIEIQVQTQFATSEREYAYIGALVGGNNVKLLLREPDTKIIAQIKARVAGFWSSVESGVSPQPDFQRDAETIRKLYSHAEPDKVLDCEKNEEIAELAAEYKLYGASEKEAKKNKEGIRSQLLMKLGDCEKGISEQFTISAGVIGPKRVEAYDRKGYRDFRINWRKNVKK